MKNQELISVIVVTYNSEKTVLDTLNSIKNQTYTNIEIVVSDDCSEDKTLDIVCDYAHRNGNVIVVPDEKNRGVPSNINKGLQAANGRFYKVIAGDDMLEPSAIDVYWKHYEDNVITVSDFSTFGCENEETMEKVKKYFSQMYFFYNLPQKKQRKVLAAYSPICAVGMGLLSVELFEKVGYFSERYKYMEDYPFYFKCANNGICFKYLDEKLVRYRISKNSLSGSFNKKSYRCSRQFFLEERGKYLLKNMQFFALIKNVAYYLKYDFLIKFNKV